MQPYLRIEFATQGTWLSDPGQKAGLLLSADLLKRAADDHWVETGRSRLSAECLLSGRSRHSDLST